MQLINRFKQIPTEEETLVPEEEEKRKNQRDYSTLLVIGSFSDYRSRLCDLVLLTEFFTFGFVPCL